MASIVCSFQKGASPDEMKAECEGAFPEAAEEETAEIAMRQGDSSAR